jgi:short-subunit dehydrogenase involved in D-alanine esterification of teichoic acids
MKTNKNTILVTGGSRGIGLALSKKFADLNNKVLIIGRNREQLEKAADYSENIIPLNYDLSQPKDIESLIVLIENKYPDLNVLVNNAGVQYNYDFKTENSILSRVESEIDINLKAPIKLTAGVLHLLTGNKESAVINVSSLLAFTPKENAPVYCATKAAVNSFTTALRYQLENTNIKVFEIIPPLVNTDMTKGRGIDKIEPEQLVEEFIKEFENDNFEINIGKVKIARLLIRFVPGLFKKKIRKS